MPAVAWEVAAPWFAAPHVVFLATSKADGSPHVVPIWAVADGEDLVFTTTDDTAKLGHLRRDPRVSLAVHAGTDPLIAFSIGGRVVGEETGDAAVALADRLSLAYDGAPWAWEPGERDHTVLIRIRPDRVLAMAAHN